MVFKQKLRIAALIVAIPLSAANSFAGLVVISGTSATVAGITAFRDQFRVALGGGTTAGANGLFDDGVKQRREINWDGVPDGFSAPNNLVSNFFNVNSPRGAVFSTAGTGFQVSGTPGVAPVNFGNIDASYTGTFSPFSAQRLFTPLGSNVMDINFFVPGTGVAGVTSGFGVIFSDVDNAGTTAIQIFDNLGNSLGAFAASPFASGFSFLGIFYDDGTTPIGRARITTGNSPLGAGLTDAAPTRDVVVMDDFIFGNPVADVPEPGTLGLFATGVVSAFLLRRRIIR